MTAGTPTRPAQAGTLLAVGRALIGPLLIGAGGAELTRAILDLLDGDVMRLPLVVGIIGCGVGGVVFLRASEPWARGAATLPGRAGGVPRFVAAGIAIALGVGTPMVVAVGIADALADSALQDACAELDGITCLIQGEGGATAAELISWISCAPAAPANVRRLLRRARPWSTSASARRGRQRR